MKLRTLASTILAATLLVALGVALIGLLVWQQTRNSLADVEALYDARDSAFKIDIAIRYLNHVHPEPDILRGLVQQSRRLITLLEDERHPEVITARLHVEEIETLANGALALLDAGNVPEARLEPMGNQIRIHETGALDALNIIIEERNRDIVATLQWSQQLLILVALATAALACLAFWLFFRRILQPIRDFSDGIQRFGDGNSSVRLPVSGKDELSDIANLFNRSMEQRETYQLLLQERIKEQQCLYLVLELTTDDNLSVAEVCQQTAELIPAHMLHEDAAMARIKYKGEVFSSSNWTERQAILSSPIRISAEETGKIEVAYSRELPDQPGGEGPFLPEERIMLNSIAKHLARMLQDRQVREALAHSQRLQAVGQLTGSIAHDFNNLLTVILGNAETLYDIYRDSDENTAEMAGMINSAANRGAELTQRLLAFARRQPLEPRPVDINRLIEDMRGLLNRTLGEHVELELKFDSGLWPAMVDPSQLETALLNLIVNARDAMPSGGWLTLETANVQLDAGYARTRPELRPGDYVLIAVSDTGTGIPRQVLQRVFEPFFTTKEPGRGTGLGLSMVHGFINQSNGHVAIYSEPEEGTTIRLYLPRSDAAEKISHAPESEPVPFGEARVLLVEDDAMVRQFTLDQLKSLGYSVQTAANGSEARAILESEAHIDLLLTDMIMPGGISGHDLANLAVELRPGLKVLYMSGYTENAIVHHGRLDPGVNLLSKPFRRADLARKVREALEETYKRNSP